jgi:hypothetical protein
MAWGTQRVNKGAVVVFKYLTRLTLAVEHLDIHGQRLSHARPAASRPDQFLVLRDDEDDEARRCHMGVGSTSGILAS